MFMWYCTYLYGDWPFKSWLSYKSSSHIYWHSTLYCSKMHIYVCKWKCLNYREQSPIQHPSPPAEYMKPRLLE